MVRLSIRRSLLGSTVQSAEIGLFAGTVRMESYPDWSILRGGDDASVHEPAGYAAKGSKKPIDQVRGGQDMWRRWLFSWLVQDHARP